MRIILKLISLISIIAVLLSVCGCTNNNSKQNLLYETVTNIVNIDPQLATNETELHVVYNTYEGLMKYNKAGVLTNGVAESYEVSENGKTYTFKLKKDVKWSDGRPLCAEDFVFAFKRAVMPETKSPYATTLLQIKNVSKILSEKKSPNTIGVKAINQHTLEFKLENVNSGFLNLLTTPVTMPCNEDFFNSCKGYYGLNEKSILSNGYYSVTAWNDEYCTLKANEKYELYDSADINTAYIYFNTQDELFENIKKQETDFTILDKSLIDRLHDADISYNSTHIENTVHSLMINPDSILAEKNILKALMGTVEFEIEKKFSKYYGIFPATSILPPIVDYSESISYKKPSLSKEKAIDSFLKGCENLKVERIFPTFSILYIKSDITEQIAQEIAAKWQNAFGVSVNITSVEDKETFDYQIESGYYDAAIISTKANSSSPTAYMQQFTSTSTTNQIKFKSKTFDRAVSKMSKTYGDDLKSSTKKAVEILEKYKYLYPLFTSSTTYYFSEEIPSQFNKHNQIVYFSQLSNN